MKQIGDETKEAKKWYEPHHYEGMNAHLYFFLLLVSSIAYQSFNIPTLPFWNSLGFSCYIMMFPIFAIYVDFRAMCERRRLIEQLTYWSENND